MEVMNRAFLKQDWWKAAAAGALSLQAAAFSQNTLLAQEAASEAVATKVSDLVEEVVSAEVELDVSLRRSKILRMKENIFRSAIADPNVLDFVAFGTREIELIGKTEGTTTVTLWLGAEDNPRILSMLVTVSKDDSVEDRNRLEYGELAAKVNELFPNSRIQLIPISDKIIVRGQAQDEEETVKILALLADMTGGSTGGGGAAGGGNGSLFSGGMAAAPHAESSLAERRIQLVNLIQVPGVKQVMLKVRVAKLTRTAGRGLGGNFGITTKNGGGGAAGRNLEDFAFGGMAFPGALAATATFDDVSVNLQLQAAISNGSAKILAEPNLVTLSGQQATFVSGGEFAVPTVVGVGGAQAATTSFRQFGTLVNFTPTVLDHDRIRLQVNPTVSAADGPAVNGIPGLSTQSVQTTVELREGQVLAIAGLLQDDQNGSIQRIPLISKIPVVSAFTSNREASRVETELLVLISPELVQPLEPDQAPTLLPGMEITEPNDLDFFVFGDIEGRQNLHHRSTVWPLYKSRMKRCQNNESNKQSSKFFLNGVHGFED